MDPGLALQDAQVRLPLSSSALQATLNPTLCHLDSGVLKPKSLTQPLCPRGFSLMLGWALAQLSAGLYPLVSEKGSEGGGEEGD